jgi:energy-converting hydrogenase B subunit D
VSVVQAIALIAVAVAGTATALVPDPLRQTFVLGIYGLTLTVLFFALQAPDVALSEIVVSTIGLPLIVIAALRKIREQERGREEDGER